MKKILSLILAIMVLLSVAVTLVSCGADTEEKLKIIDVKLTNEEYAFVAKKGNTQLVTSFNSFLDDIKADGTFDTLVSKYFEGKGEKVGYSVTTTDVKNTDSNLVVVTNCPFEPFEYVGNDGMIYGLDIEIAAAYAAANNLELVIKNIGFDDIFTQVDAGYADIGMAGITVNEDRAALYDFTSLYYEASQKIIVDVSNTDFDNCKTVDDVEKILSSLDGESIGFQTGTTGGMYVEGDDEWGFAGFSNVDGKGYSTAQVAVMDLMNGNLYAVILDEAPARFIVEAFNSNSDWGVKWDTFISTMKNKSFRRDLVIGLFNTIQVAVIGLLIGIVIGSLIAVVKVAPKYKLILRILDKICSVYVAIFRGTPIVVQLLLAYYVILPTLGVHGIGSLAVGIIVFGMNSGAYVSEIMRGGLNSVDRGQMEAGRAVGLSYPTTMIKIVIPQAIKNILPTLGNEFVTLIKETSVLSMIAVYDLYEVLINKIGGKNYEMMVPSLVLAAIYIILVLMITMLVKTMEGLFAKSDKNKTNNKKRGTV